MSNNMMSNHKQEHKIYYVISFIYTRGVPMIKENSFKCTFPLSGLINPLCFYCRFLLSDFKLKGTFRNELTEKESQ
jgi:hypothetical protein